MIRLGWNAGLLTDKENAGFRELLQFRHMHIHGYGYMLDVIRLRELAAPVPALLREYLAGIVPPD